MGVGINGPCVDAFPEATMAVGAVVSPWAMDFPSDPSLSSPSGWWFGNVWDICYFSICIYIYIYRERHHPN